MKKLISSLIISAILLSGCTQSIAGSSSNSSSTPSSSSTPPSEPLDLPVAKVSGEYAEDAMKILKSFYDANAKELVSEDVLNAPVTVRKYENGKFVEEIECKAISDYSYQPTGLDPHFYTWGQATSEIRNGKTLKEVFELADKETDVFYGTATNFYTVLSMDGKTVIAEGAYDDRAGEYKGEIYWLNFRKCPSSSLFLDNKLMKALKDEGFDISTTTAKSCFNSVHSIGIYFSDGKIERYYPQIFLMDNIETIMELYVFYSPEEFADLLDKGEDINAKNLGFDTTPK